MLLYSTGACHLDDELRQLLQALGVVVIYCAAAGDSLVEGILTRIRQEHELSAAERKRALDEAMAALPKEVLVLLWPCRVPSQYH